MMIGFAVAITLLAVMIGNFVPCVVRGMMITVANRRSLALEPHVVFRHRLQLLGFPLRFWELHPLKRSSCEVA